MLLSAVFKQSVAWPHLKQAKKTEDGRYGYHLLYNHYLGSSNVDHMAAQAETVLATYVYKGEGPKFNFESYSTKHQEQHNILESLEDHGYKGLDDRSKVRHLNSGIKTQVLDSVKTRILSDSILRSDFGECVKLYKDFIKQSNTAANVQRGIAALTLGDSTEKKVTFKAEDKFYKPEVWSAMSREDRDEVLKLRKNRKAAGSYAGGGSRGSNNKWKKQIKALTKTVSKQKRQLAALRSTDTSGEDSDVDIESNRNHSGLTRQKKRPKK